MLKCERCEFSQMKRGYIECSLGSCAKSQEWVDKIYSRKYNEIANAKAEAYREFADKLTTIISESIEKSLDNPGGNTYYLTDVYKDIDNLVKELTEGGAE